MDLPGPISGLRSFRAQSEESLSADHGKLADVLSGIPPLGVLTPPVIGRAAAVRQKRLQIAVEEPSGVARRGCPVRFAVPIPRGELRDPSRAALFDDEGTRLPLQTKATCFWPEGDVKWLLLEFTASLRPGAQRQYVLEYGTQVPPWDGDDGVTVTGRDGHLRVQAGNLWLSFVRGGAAWVDAIGVGRRLVTAQGLGVLGFLRYSRSSVRAPGRMTEEEEAKLPWEQTQPSDQVFAMKPRVTGLEVVERGPVQVTVRVDGVLAHRDLELPVRLYVRTYATGYIEITHTLTYAGYPSRDHVREYGIELQMASRTDAVATLSGDGKRMEYDAADAPALTQSSYERFAVTVRGREDAVCGARTDGWIDVYGGGLGVTAAVQHAWQNHPVRMSAASYGGRPALRIALFGGAPGGFLDLRYPQEGHTSASYRCGDRLGLVGRDAWGSARGLAKTHRLMLFVREGGASTYPELGPALDRPLLVRCSPAYVASTRAVGTVTPYDADKRLHGVREYVSLLLDYCLFLQSANALYGTVDYGDLPTSPKWTGPEAADAPLSVVMEGAEGWCNGQAIALPFVLHYLMGGHRRYWDFAEHSLRHSMDVDAEHLGAAGWLPGRFSRHDQLHWRRAGGPQHGPARAALCHYWLTGDLRTWDAISALADSLTGYRQPNQVMLDPEAGAAYHLLLLLWETTRDGQYLPPLAAAARAQRELVEAGLSLPDRPTRVPLQGGKPKWRESALGSPSGQLRTGLSGPWLSEGFADALVEYAELTGDQEVVRALVTIGAVGLASGELASRSPYTTSERLLSWLFACTGDRRYRDTLLEHRLKPLLGWDFTGSADAHGAYAPHDFRGRRGGFVGPSGRNSIIAHLTKAAAAPYALTPFAAPRVKSGDEGRRPRGRRSGRARG